MISERILRQWRRDSLTVDYPDSAPSESDLVVFPHVTVSINHLAELHQRIIQLTQELMDNHLIRK
jgi:SPX domain protein involved in polyphosphate accumulation